MSDDEDSDHGGQQDGTNYRERRREAHTEAERKRREAIKVHYTSKLCIWSAMVAQYMYKLRHVTKQLIVYVGVVCFVVYWRFFC